MLRCDVSKANTTREKPVSALRRQKENDKGEVTLLRALEVLKAKTCHTKSDVVHRVPRKRHKANDARCRQKKGGCDPVYPIRL